MKITKDYLRTVIKEELERLEEGVAATSEDDIKIKNILLARAQTNNVKHVKDYIDANFQLISPELSKDIESGRLGGIVRKAYADALNSQQSGGVANAAFHKQNLKNLNRDNKENPHPMNTRRIASTQKAYSGALSDIGASKKQVR